MLSIVIHVPSSVACIAYELFWIKIAQLALTNRHKHTSNISTGILWVNWIAHDISQPSAFFSYFFRFISDVTAKCKQWFSKSRSIESLSKVLICATAVVVFKYCITFFFSLGQLNGLNFTLKWLEYETTVFSRLSHGYLYWMPIFFHKKIASISVYLISLYKVTT